MSVWTYLTPQERARLHACADCQQPLPFDSGGYDTRRDLWGHSDRGNPIPTGGYVCDACWPPHRDRLDRVALPDRIENEVLLVAIGTAGASACE